MCCRYLFRDLGQALVCITAVVEPFSAIENRDNMLSSLPCSDELGPGLKFSTPARWLLLGGSSGIRRLAPSGSDRSSQQTSRFGVQPAGSRGLDLPGQLPKKKPFRRRWGRRAARLPPNEAEFTDFEQFESLNGRLDFHGFPSFETQQVPSSHGKRNGSSRIGPNNLDFSPQAVKPPRKSECRLQRMRTAEKLAEGRRWLDYLGDNVGA